MKGRTLEQNRELVCPRKHPQFLEDFLVDNLQKRLSAGVMLLEQSRCLNLQKIRRYFLDRCNALTAGTTRKGAGGMLLGEQDHESFLNRVVLGHGGIGGQG